MRKLSLLSILAILTLSLGLSSAQSEAIILQVAVSDFAEDALQATIEEYEAQHPNIQVELVNYDGFGMPVNPNSDAETYQDDLASYFQLADVVLVDDGLTSEATRVGYALELTPLTQSDPNYNESMYYQTMTDAFKWDFGQWAIPISSSFITMTYSPEAFDAMGLNYPSGDWTLDDLLFAADSLTQYNSDGSITIPGLLIQGGNNLDALLISLLGHSLADETAFPSIPDYSDPALVELLDQLIALDADNYTSLPTDVDNEDVPMRISNPQQGGGGGFGGQNQDLTTATALLPGGFSVMNVLGYAVSSGTNYPMEAYELALFLSQDVNAIAVSGGTASALVDAPDTTEVAGFGRGGGGQNVTEAFEPLLETAIANGMTQADLQFIAGLGDALDVMESDALSASDALETILTEQLDRLVVADTRASTTQFTVNPPVLAPILSAGEIVLEFGILAGGRGGGGVADTWEILAEEFVAQDSQVAQVTIEQLPPNGNTIPETTQCFYSSSNLVTELDLSTVLSLDPLLFSDPNYDPNDFVANILPQVQVDGMTYALPLNITPLVMSVDSAYFNEVGVPVPNGSWTVSEFEDALRQLSTILDADTAPLAITGSTPLLNLIAIYGGQPFDLSTDPIMLNFTDPATVTAIQQVLDLAQAGLISYSGGGFGGGGGGANQNTSPIVEQSLTGGAGFGGRGNNNNANTDLVTVTFPIGLQGNAVALDLGTMYINANSQNPDACYRFMSYVTQSADAFNSMPARLSLINSSRLVNAQGQATVDFYNATADLMAQSDTLILPTNIDQFGFGMTQWLTTVFDAYLAGEVTDLTADLELAQQRTQDYLSCVDNITVDFETGNRQSIQQDIQACLTLANA